MNTQEMLQGVKNYIDTQDAGLIFDISEANAESGVPATYDDLSKALGTGGANVPASVRDGGMSVKFIQQLYTVAKTTSSSAPSGGTPINSDPGIGNGSAYTAADLSAFSSLPTSSSVVYYLSDGESTPTYTIWTISKNAIASCPYVQWRYMGTSTSTGFTTITNWQGVTSEIKSGSKDLVESGAIAEELALGAVYDVSAKNPTAGPNNDGKFTLEYILNNANTLIPTAVRKPGMSLKFAHSVDNKYVQYRLMTTTWSTTVSDWQGVDDEIKYGSQNLAESGAVKAITGEKTTTKTYSILSNIINDGTQFISSNSTYNSFVIKLVKGQVFKSPIFTNCINKNNSVYANKPVIGEQVTPSYIDLPYTAANDCYLMVAIKSYTNAASMSYVTRYGIEREIEDIEATIANIQGSQIQDEQEISNIRDLVGNDPNNSDLVYSGLSGIVWDDGTFVSANLSYNSFVINLHKNQTITLGTFSNCQLQSLRLFSVRPVIGVSATATALSGTPYTADSDCYLMITINNFNSSATIECELSGWGGLQEVVVGINKELKDTELVVEGKVCKIVGMGTKGGGNSGVTDVGQVYFNTYNKNLNLCTAYRTTTDFDTKIIPFYDGAIYTYQGELYIWNGNDFVKKTGLPIDNIVDAWSQNAVQGGAVRRSIGEKEHTDTLVYSDLSNLIYDGTKFISKNSSYNSFVLHLYKNQTITLQTFTNCTLANARVFYVEPKLNVEATSIAFVDSTYTAVQDCYVMVAISNYSSSSSMTYLAKSFGIYKDIEETYITPLSTEQTNIKNKIKYLNDDFSGKTIMCFGDSLLSFYFEDNYNVPNYLAKYSNATVYNAAVGGTRWSARIGSPTFPTTQNDCWNCLDIVNLVSAWVDNDFTNVDEAVRLLNTEYETSTTGTTARNRMLTALKAKRPSEIDIIIIMAGSNDFNGGAVIGQIDSTTITEMYGGFNSAITDLLTANTSLKIYLFSNTVKWFQYAQGTGLPENFSDVYTNTRGYTIPEINEAIKEGAEKYKLPFCDMYNTLTWNMLNFSTYFGQNDGQHPYYGRDVIARKMFAFLAANRLNP